MSQETTAHPFELAGMNRGPYAFAGIYEMPNLGEDSAANFANPNPYADAPRLNGGLGTCCNCGMAITVICIIRDADGGLWGVGSDCAEKAGDPALGSKVKIEVAKRRNRMARDRKEAKRQEQRAIWLATACNDKGETNQQRLDREHAEFKAKERQQAEKRERAAAVLKPLANLIADGKGGFCDSIANDMRNGFVPYGRGRSIALDIIAKCYGRSNSAIYSEKLDWATEVMGKAEDVLASSI